MRRVAMQRDTRFESAGEEGFIPNEAHSVSVHDFNAGPSCPLMISRKVPSWNAEHGGHGRGVNHKTQTRKKRLVVSTKRWSRCRMTLLWMKCEFWVVISALQGAVYDRALEFA